MKENLLNLGGGGLSPILSYQDFLDWIENHSKAYVLEDNGYPNVPQSIDPSSRIVAQLDSRGWQGSMYGTPYRGYINIYNSSPIRIIQHALPSQSLANEYSVSQRKALMSFSTENTNLFEGITRNGYTSQRWAPQFLYPGQLLKEFIYWDQIVLSAMRWDPSIANSVPESFQP